MATETSGRWTDKNNPEEARWDKSWNKSPGRMHYYLTEEQLQQIEQLSQIQCTEGEIAHALGLHRNTFRELKGRQGEIEKRILTGQSKGKRALRSVQFKVALSGNVPMLMFMGRVYLNQIPEAQVQFNVGENETPTVLSPAAKMHLAELARSIAQAARDNTPEVETEVRQIEDGNGQTK